MRTLREIPSSKNWEIKQKGLVTENIQQSYKLSLRVKNISNDNLLDPFMWTLKGNIQHDVCLLEQRSLKNDFRVARKVESKNMAARRTTTNTYRKHNFPSPNPTQPTRLTPQQFNGETSLYNISIWNTRWFQITRPPWYI